MPPVAGNISPSDPSLSDPIKPPKYTFREVKQKSFVGIEENFLIAQNESETKDTIAIRIRTAHYEWMNELQVYLLPNFSHNNVLMHYGSEKLYKGTGAQSIRLDNYRQEDEAEDRIGQMKIEYWLMNMYHNCITLREFLKQNTLTWTQTVAIAKGIAKGLYYLHENAEFQDFDVTNATDGFIASTNGQLKKVSFVDQRHNIKMRPPLELTIVHHNLSSMNIVLKEDFTPCIWNFGNSFVHYPFQPIIYPRYIEKKMKDIFTTSQYSPPEVIRGSSRITFRSMKSIDLYACGILFWELLSRTVLPKLESASEKEHEERSNPGKYYEPFEEEFEGFPLWLEHAVCWQQARPSLKNCWLVGKKTVEFVKTIMDLWDHDFDARIHSSTVIQRLEKLDLSDQDTRFRHKFIKPNQFVKPDKYPPDLPIHQAPTNLDKFRPNIRIEDVVLPVRVQKTTLNCGSEAKGNQCPLQQSSISNKSDGLFASFNMFTRNSTRARSRLVATITDLKGIRTEQESSIKTCIGPNQSLYESYIEIELGNEMNQPTTLTGTPEVAETSLAATSGQTPTASKLLVPSSETRPLNQAPERFDIETDEGPH